MKKKVLILTSLLAFTLMPSLNTYAADFHKDGTAVIEVSADARNIIWPEYKVVLDPYLKLSWESKDDYVGSYNVAVKGTLPEGVAVSVKPDSDFVVKDGEMEYEGMVTQERSLWINKDFGAEDHGITDNAFDSALTINISESTKGTARVSIPGEGHFEGDISFTFKMEKLK